MAIKSKINFEKALDFYEQTYGERITEAALFRMMRNSMDRQTARNWKMGKGIKQFDKLSEIAEICGCDMEDIYEQEPFKNK